MLRAGDVVVQRGTNHAWANRSDEVVRIAFVLVDAEFDPALADQLGAEAAAETDARPRGRGRVAPLLRPREQPSFRGGITGLLIGISPRLRRS